MMLNKNYNNAQLCILVRSGLDYDSGNDRKHCLGTAGMRRECDEIAFSGVMRVNFYPSRNYLTYKGL